MTNAKHTPGPWRIVNDGNYRLIEADIGKSWNNPTVCHLFVDVTPEDSVTIGPWYNSFDNDEANARLIAAAPDLLAALEALLNDDFADLFSARSADDARMARELLRIQASKAIAKAKGGF
jgi:hypothetical protein